MSADPRKAIARRNAMRRRNGDPPAAAPALPPPPRQPLTPSGQWQGRAGRLANPVTIGDPRQFQPFTNGAPPF